MIGKKNHIEILNLDTTMLATKQSRKITKNAPRGIKMTKTEKFFIKHRDAFLAGTIAPENLAKYPIKLQLRYWKKREAMLPNQSSAAVADDDGSCFCVTDEETVTESEE